MDDFLEVRFTKRLRTPKGIAQRIPGVWVLSLPMYFNCCPFYLKNPNCRSPSGEKLIFISKKGIFLFGVGEFAQSVNISPVNLGVGFPPPCSPFAENLQISL